MILLALAALILPNHRVIAPPNAVLRVENGGLLFTDNPAGVSGTDAGYSLPIGKRTLWLFGDVFLLSPTPERKYVGGISNAALLVPSGAGSAVLRSYQFVTDENGLAAQVIPNLDGEDARTRLWPFGGWFDDSSRAAYLYYVEVRTTGSGPLDFKAVGHGLCRAKIAGNNHISFERLKSGPWWPTSGSVFGSAVVAGTPVSDPNLYIVGYRETGQGKRGLLARVRKTQIESLAAYDYCTGSGNWSKSVADAVDIEGLNDFPSELSVAYNPHLKGYLAIHSVGIGQSIRLSLASQPWGPYREIATIGAPHRAFEKAMCYAGKEHPELAEKGGKVIYITYVDQQRYWLQLLKVTLK